MALLQLLGVEQAPILRPVTALFEAGRMVGIIGPNGAGKSTLLKTIAMLLPPTSGRVMVGGTDINVGPARRRAQQVAFLPQTLSEDIPYTVREFVEMGRFSHQSMWSSVDRDGQIAVDDAIDEMGLRELIDAPLAMISGGERQRAGIARCLAQASPVLLLDEPISNLDVYYQLDIMTKLSRLAQQGHLILLAIHHLEFALRFCDELLVVHQGQMFARGTVDEVFTAELVKQVFHVDATLFVDPVRGHPRLSLEHSGHGQTAQRPAIVNEVKRR